MPDKEQSPSVTELVAHARELRSHLNDDLPNGVGNTIDALCARLEVLLAEREKLREALSDTLSVCEYVMSKPDAYDALFGQLVHAHAETARAALSIEETDYCGIVEDSPDAP